MEKKLRTAFAILLILALSFAFAACGSKDDADQKALEEAADKLNAQCPMTIDSETVLDNVVASAGKVFQYNYTLVNYASTDFTAEEVAELQTTIEDYLISTIASNSDMAELRDMGTTFKYVYKANDGAELVSITITPDQY